MSSLTPLMAPTPDGCLCGLPQHTGGEAGYPDLGVPMHRFRALGALSEPVAALLGSVCFYDREEHGTDWALARLLLAVAGDRHER